MTMAAVPAQVMPAVLRGSAHTAAVVVTWRCVVVFGAASESLALFNIPKLPIARQSVMWAKMEFEKPLRWEQRCVVGCVRVCVAVCVWLCVAVACVTRGTHSPPSSGLA